MKKKNILKRMGAFCLCILMLTGNFLGAYGAEEMMYHIHWAYQDMYGEDGAELFETTVHTEELVEGSEVEISVNYKGSNGWVATITAMEEPLDYEMTSNSISFTMPNADVEILLQEMENYDKGDLSGEDTSLGEDIGKQHDVTTSRAYEPDVSIGKAAKWDNIEEGLATLTLTEKDTSDWSDNPSDYIIVLDRTRTMALDDTCFWSENTSKIGSTNSVCLNENHFYLYNGKPAKLIDYSNGIWLSDKTYFSLNGGEKTLWNAHYNSSGTRITPSLSNGCVDRLALAQKSIKDIMTVLDEQNKKELAGGLKNRVMYWSFSGPTYKDLQLHPNGLWDEVPSFTTDISAAKNAVKYQSYAGTYYNNSFEKILNEIQKKQSDQDYKDIPTKVIFISDGLLQFLLLSILLCLSVQFSSVAQSYPTLCDPMNRCMPDLPVHHQLPEFTQTHVLRVSDVIQASNPLSSSSPPAPNPSQHQGLFQ